MRALARFDSLAPHDFLPKDRNANVPPKPNTQELPDRTATILNLVKAHPDGVTAGDIAEALEMASNTVLKTLRELEREREVYSRAHNRGQAQVWYPNGRLIHPYLELFLELRGKPFRFSVQESRTGPVVQIQERSFSLIAGERVEGAIFVEYTALDQFLEGLQEIRNRYETNEKVKVKK